MVLSDSTRKEFPDNRRSTGAYIVFYQGGPIDHFTHVPGPVSQSIAESEYNAVCTAGMDLEQFMIINNEMKKMDTIRR